MNDRNKVIVLVGAALLVVGVFLPLVRVPKLGTVSFIADGDWKGIVVLLLGLAAGVLALIERTEHALWPGLASLGVIAFTFFTLQSRMAEMRGRAAGVLGDDRLGERLADVAANAVKLEYGWAVLVIGAILAIAGGALAWRRRG